MAHRQWWRLGNELTVTFGGDGGCVREERRE